MNEADVFVLFICWLTDWIDGSSQDDDQFIPQSGSCVNIILISTKSNETESRATELNTAGDVDTVGAVWLTSLCKYTGRGGILSTFEYASVYYNYSLGIFQ